MLDSSVVPDQGIVAITSDDAFVLGVLSSSVHLEWARIAGGTLEDRPRYNQTRCFETFPFPDVQSPELKTRIRSLAEQIDTHRKAQQARHPEVTLTGLYNVLEKLRSEEPLTAKERSIHDNGLVSVLWALHEELDAAVLAAYGWADLRLPADLDTLLHRLVTLNALRASEEASGVVRWLRPELQQTTGTQAGIDISQEPGVQRAPQPILVAKQPWPARLPEQIKVIADVLSAQPAPAPIDAIAAHFSSRGRWRERLPTILETLEALGRAREARPGHWIDTGVR